MSESALLTAVRDTLRTDLDLEDRQCQVEYDGLPAAVVGDLFLAVLPVRVPAHPTDDSSGGVKYDTYDVDVIIVMRTTGRAFDRRRDKFLGSTAAMTAIITSIKNAIRFSYVVTAAANVIILADEPSTQGFILPLKYRDVSKIDTVGSEHFQARSGENAAGITRRIMFGGAQRIQT